MMVRDFQSVIGKECLEQMPEMTGGAARRGRRLRRRRQQRHGHLPPLHPAREDAPDRRRGGRRRAWTAASIRLRCSAARPGVLHGNRTYILQDENGQITETHSVSAGLDYPGVGPGACLAQGHRPRRVRRHHRQGGAGSLPLPVPHRRHHPGAGVEPCDRLRDEAGPHHEAGADPSWSTCPGAATRTSARWPTWPAWTSTTGPRCAACRSRARRGAPHEPHRTPPSRRCKRQGRKALIPYVTAGFPFADITPELMHGMVAAGADVIELGVPFSDPMADGPVIQKAGEQALAAGVGTRQVLEMVREFRRRDSKTPVVLMGYANPVERYDLMHGKDAFVRDAAQAGVDGILIVDYPPEECEDFAAKLKAQRPGPDLPAGADQHRRTHAPGRARGQRLRLLRVAQGRDGRRQPGHRRRGADAAAHPPACADPGRRRLRHPRRRHGRRPSARWPTRW